MRKSKKEEELEKKIEEKVKDEMKDFVGTDTQVLYNIKDLITEARQVKNGDWKTDRQLFEQKISTKLDTIEGMLEKYTNVIQRSVWFFKFMNFLHSHIRYLILFLFLIILIVNVIQYIPIVYWIKLFLVLIGVKV